MTFSKGGILIPVIHFHVQLRERDQPFVHVIGIGFKKANRASLVVQWLRICLPMQGTRVRALVWEDPTCRRATRPVSHNY